MYYIYVHASASQQQADLQQVESDLFEAIDDGDIDRALELLDTEGLNINAKPDIRHNLHFGWSFLICAVKRDREPVVEKLIAKGVDVNAVTTQNSSALDFAVMLGYEGIVQKLIASNLGLDLNHKGPQGRTALYMAAERGYLNIVNDLIDAGADLNIASEFGTPLRAAMSNNHPEVIARLREVGASETPVVRHEHEWFETQMHAIKADQKPIKQDTRPNPSSVIQGVSITAQQQFVNLISHDYSIPEALYILKNANQLLEPLHLTPPNMLEQKWLEAQLADVKLPESIELKPGLILALQVNQQVPDNSSKLHFINLINAGYSVAEALSILHNIIEGNDPLSGE